MIIAIVTTVTFYIRAFATTSIKGTNVHCGDSTGVVRCPTRQSFIQLQLRDSILTVTCKKNTQLKSLEIKRNQLKLGAYVDLRSYIITTVQLYNCTTVQMYG